MKRTVFPSEGCADAMVAAGHAAEAANAIDNALILQGVEKIEELRLQRDRLRSVLERILEANEAFRSDLPEGWDGDPVDDACKEGEAVLASL